jgi:hypothetical protein
MQLAGTQFSFFWGIYGDVISWPNRDRTAKEGKDIDYFY